MVEGQFVFEVKNIGVSSSTIGVHVKESSYCVTLAKLF